VAPSVQRRKVWLTPTTRVPCSNDAKTRKPLKLAGVPQTNEPVSAASGLKFTILWEHVEETLLFNMFLHMFFSDCRYVPQLRRYSQKSYVMVPGWQIFGDFLGPVKPQGKNIMVCSIT